MKSRLRCWKGLELSRIGRQFGMIGGVFFLFLRRGRERKLLGFLNSGILLKLLVFVFIKIGCLDIGVRSGVQSTGVVIIGVVRFGVNVVRVVVKGGVFILILMQTVSKNKDFFYGVYFEFKQFLCCFYFFIYFYDFSFCQLILKLYLIVFR